MQKLTKTIVQQQIHMYTLIPLPFLLNTYVCTCVVYSVDDARNRVHLHWKLIKIRFSSKNL